MANILTFQKVINTLQDIAERHYLINTFFVGENHDMNAADIAYPVFQVYPDTAKFPQNFDGEFKTIDFTLKCKIVDNDRQDNTAQPETYSNTFQICQDIINEINQHPYFLNSNITIFGDVNVSQLNEFVDDFTVGWEFDLNLRLINNNSFCGLPIADIVGYSASGPVSSGYSMNMQYLQCDSSISGCSYLSNFIDYRVNLSSGSSANYYTTSANLVGTIAYFNRNDMASAYTLDLSSLVVSGYLPITGGTVTGPTSFTTLSATTYISGSTNLYDIINSSTTHVQNGLNTYTGGTALNPSVNISALTINNITVSGSASFNTLSASTYYSGSTNLYSIISNMITGVTTGITSNIQNGLNTYTGGTGFLPTVNISGASLNYLNVSGLTYLSASTASTVSILNSGVTTANLTDWNFNTIKTGITTSNIIGGSGNTINNDLRNVQIIGGVGITAQTSDTTFVNKLTGTSIYGSTIYSGGTDLSLLIGGAGINYSAELATKANLSGATFTGVISSGGTELSLLFAKRALPFEIGVAMSDEITTITSATTATVTMQIPFSGTLTSVYFSLGTSGSTISTYNVKKSSTPGVGGTTIFSTRPTIDANEFSTATALTPAVITGGTIAINDTLTFFVDTQGTGSKSLKAWLVGTKTS